jgi:hypothetical protein
VGYVLPLPKTTSLEWGMHPKQKGKIRTTIPKKFKFDPIYVELDLELQRCMCQRLAVSSIYIE